MRLRSRTGRFCAILIGVLFTSVAVFSYQALGEGPARITLEAASSQTLSLVVGKSLIAGSPEIVKRVSLAAPDIADAVVLTPRQVMLTGKSPGITNLILWGADNKVAVILDVEVSPDISRLKATLQKILPEETDVRVTATHDNITLSGTVSSTTKKEQILSLTEPYFPKKVVDLLKVQPSNTDISVLEKMLGEVFPDERDVRVSATDDKVVISGTVSSKVKIDQVMALAESYFPKKVVNLLQVEAPPDTFSSKISQFKGKLHEILPQEKEIKITAVNDNITLWGSVSSTSNLSQVLALAGAYFPRGRQGEKIVNLLEVGGVHQVMLEVRVAEMSRSLLRRLGFNFSYVSSSGRNLGLSLLNKLTRLPGGTVSPTNPLVVSDPVNGIFRFLSNDTSWTLFIDALKEEGLLKVLAEPTLITLSGKTANFLAGGEFPVPVPQAAGVSTTITVQYKPFGVGLNFTPTVLSSEKINMIVAPEVSELDFSNAITVSGFTIPALTTRRVSTVIELGDGQSFAIAGLLRDEIREIVSKFPVLGEIPILGALFRSSSFQKNETELIVIVTPHLVKPLDMAKQTLPTDQFIEPDDFEFYLLGNMEGKERVKSNAPARKGEKKMKLEGDFGHIIPK